MKALVLYAGCLALLLCFYLEAGYTAQSGSPRAEVQKNFEQLVRSKSCPGCDLAGAVLIRLDLRGANLEGANLAGAKLQLADLSGANLRNVNLQGARLGGADFAKADLRGANLTGAVLEGAFTATAIIDGDIITRAPDAHDAFSGSGETVHVPLASTPKNVPYTEDITVGKRVDLESPPPEVRSVQPATSDEVVAPVQEVVVLSETNKLAKSTASDVTPRKERAAALEPGAAGTSKKLSPMADLHLPATVASGLQEKEGAALEPHAVQATATKQPVRPANSIVAAKRKKVVKSGVPIDEGWPVLKENSKHKPAQKAVSGVRFAPAGEQPVPTVPLQAGEQQQPGASRSREEGASEAVSESPAEVSGEVSKMVPEATFDQGRLDLAQKPAEALKKQQDQVERMWDAKRCVSCDLSGLDFSGKGLQGYDLERSDFSGSKLVETDLRGANLKGSVFHGADLREADLRKADLYKADFTGADLTGARLEGALKDSVHFSGARGLQLEKE